MSMLLYWRRPLVPARASWYSSPVHAYCLGIGISSWEGLWCRFEGDEPNTRWLRDWSPEYRRETWRLALIEQGIDDPGLAEELGARFGTERRARHETFPDAVAALKDLSLQVSRRYSGDQSRSHALVTNGASCLQREKLAASGLGDYFVAVVVSAEMGIGKPDPAIFKQTLAQLECDPAQATMIGDSLSRDIDGARAAGVRGVWINRFGHARPHDHAEVAEVSTLSGLPGAMDAFGD
jgi:putative hydrolase of the HAD superfamily